VNISGRKSVLIHLCLAYHVLRKNLIFGHVSKILNLPVKTAQYNNKILDVMLKFEFYRDKSIISIHYEESFFI